MWMRNQLGPLAHHLPNLPTWVGKFDVSEIIELFVLAHHKTPKRGGQVGKCLNLLNNLTCPPAKN